MVKQSHPLRVWRKEHGVTLQALAESLNVSPAHLSEIENWNNAPSLDLAARLQDHTAIDMKEFVKSAESAA